MSAGRAAPIYWAALLALAAIPAAARADVLCLVDGRIVDGVKLERVEQGIALHYPSGDVLVPAGLVLDALIEGEVAPEPATPEEREQRAKGFVRFEGKWMSVTTRDKLLAKRLQERREQIEDQKAHQLWRNRRLEATKHFAFEYTVPQHLFEPLRDRMEAYFEAFAREWSVKPPRELGKLTVCYYADRENFHQTSGAPGNVLGYFRFVKPMELNVYYDRLDHELTEEVMFHETNHYLQRLIEGDFAMPHFPGEALAEYYGASSYDPKTRKFTTGLVLEGRLAAVKQDLLAGERMGLAKLVGEDGLYEHYTWGWSLVHYLMHDARYEKKFQRFVQTLARGNGVKRVDMGVDGLRTVEGPEVLRVFRAELGLGADEAFAALEKEWHHYVERELRLVGPKGLARAAEFAERHGLKIKAKRLYQEAIDAGSESAVTFHRAAKLLAGDGGGEQAALRWRRAIELDPLEAEFHWELGRLLQQRETTAEEGRKLVALAREIDPEAEFWRRADVEDDGE